MATAEIRHVSTASSLTPSCGFAAQRLRCANPFFRSSSLLSMPVRLALPGYGYAPSGSCARASGSRYCCAFSICAFLHSKKNTKKISL